jgi:hypothetical protein
MIIAKNLQSVYKNNKEELLKLVAKDQNKPIGFDELEYSFIDLQGKKYYSFPEATALPIERLAKMEEYKVYMSSGLHNQAITEITDYMQSILEKIVNSGIDNEVKKNSSKNIGDLGMLIRELKERQKTFIPIEIYYAFLAIQLVREDENPYMFNNSVHNSKIAALMDLNEINGGFFFGQRESKQLQSWLNMSETEWSEYWENSMEYHRIKLKALEIYLSNK